MLDLQWLSPVVSRFAAAALGKSDLSPPIHARRPAHHTTPLRVFGFSTRLSLQVKKTGKEEIEPGDRQLTWTILLARWTQFAKSSLKLPKTAEGDRWRAAVAPIISLQAVTNAMAELDELEFDERALAFDKSQVIVRSRAEELNTLWAGEELPEAIIEMIGDAKLAIECAAEGGLEWRLIQEHLQP